MAKRQLVLITCELSNINGYICQQEVARAASTADRFRRSSPGRLGQTFPAALNLGVSTQMSNSSRWRAASSLRHSSHSIRLTCCNSRMIRRGNRSEEHTSELQSPCNL